MISRLKSPLIATAAVALMSAMPAQAQAQNQDRPGEGVTITMARPTWDTGWFHTEIYRQMLAELGYDVSQPMTLDNPAFYQAVGYGDVTMWVDGWFPNHDTYRPAFESGAEIVGAVALGGALEGYLVSKDAAERLNIVSVEDFKRDDVKEAFDRNGDGKADLVACPPGWGCELVLDHHFDAYDLRDHVNPIKAGYAASMADAVAAHESGEPVFFYTWTPNWTVSELVPAEDVVWIEVPKVDLPEHMMSMADAATREGVAGCVSDPCRLGIPASDIVSVVNSDFLNDNPAVRALLEAAEIPLADMSAQSAKMNAGDTDIAAHATAWIAENRATVDGWLEQARAAAN
ncbi:glycine betaine/L-proline ABC transporter substrate-binding protein ProX [Paracoccus sp. (in: a-proteobacteria)]|uniref:glycine betaine/L-proline ABC transporter substrate-binding protein ProX n=1 Tax=Paracoccus sp. TaxID=267 RepID=UPI0026E00927|nr:glycine betaine/L-proline ABC transporter substrate-binding protein ProX [Paracoccus sp. (in: a-proteobacteria)]MDO5369595.1 glycine betaine/L-proline ABC transporter substrate-binding protein ProX [Paracoccus sp. (in: a-proteobacteria)]